MTSDNTGARNVAPQPGRRFSLGALIAAGLAGLVLGAIATFAFTGLVWTVRVELPAAPPGWVQPPPTAPPGWVSPPPTAPAPGPSIIPAPPLPPGPR
jgi:hypothetical protein